MLRRVCNQRWRGRGLSAAVVLQQHGRGGDIDDIYQSQIVICECTLQVPGGGSYCATVKRCELNYLEKGDPNLCGGFEILFNHCEEEYNNCQVAVVETLPTKRLKARSMTG